MCSRIQARPRSRREGAYPQQQPTERKRAAPLDLAYSIVASTLGSIPAHGMVVIHGPAAQCERLRSRICELSVSESYESSRREGQNAFLFFRSGIGGRAELLAAGAHVEVRWEAVAVGASLQRERRSVRSEYSRRELVPGCGRHCQRVSMPHSRAWMCAGLLSGVRKSLGGRWERARGG